MSTLDVAAQHSPDVKAGLAGAALAALLLTHPIAAGAKSGAVQYKNVTDARLAAAAGDDGWLMYRHDYGSSGFSKLGLHQRQSMSPT